MERLAELALIRRMLAHLEAGTTDEAPGPLRIPPAHHASPEHLERERHALFRNPPIPAALSADLPEAGSYLTLRSGGIPLLLMRGRDGRVRAFVNICRHRGAPVASGRGNLSGGHLRCPFHAWTYDEHGALATIPLGESGFSACERATLGLLPRPCSESHGLILVRPAGERAIDAGSWLGELSEDLAVLGLDRFHHFTSRTTSWNANWKLLLETFLESYHVFSLHRETVHPHYLSLPMVADRIGAHLRFPVARRSVADLRGKPESEWRLVEHATVQWYLAPNALLSATRDYALLWRFESPAPGRTVVETHFYTAHPVASEADRQRFDAAFELQLRVTGSEDFPMQERIQAGLESGVAADLIVGAHEIGVIHLHETLAQLLADTQDERRP